MAGITLSQAESRLQSYLDAEEAILAGQTIEFNGRRLTRANLGEIQQGIDLWDARVKTLTNSASGRGRSRSIAPGF